MGCSDAVMVRMFLSLLDHPADCSSQEPLILRISDDFIPDDFMHLLNDDKITNYGQINKKGSDDVPQYEELGRYLCFTKVEALFDKN